MEIVYATESALMTSIIVATYLSYRKKPHQLFWIIVKILMTEMVVLTINNLIVLELHNFSITAFLLRTTTCKAITNTCKVIVYLYIYLYL